MRRAVTPYRTNAHPPQREPPPDDDDRMILWVALCISLLGLVPRLIAGGPWGAESALALLIAATSSVLLILGGSK